MGLEDVVLAIDWQFVKAPAVSDRSLPARHGEVFHGDTLELEDAGGVVVQLLTILKIKQERNVSIIFRAISTRRHLDVGHPNLYFIQLVQNVSLSETQGCVSIQLTREPFQISNTFPIIHGNREGIHLARM